jgi:hypothetical protein
MGAAAGSLTGTTTMRFLRALFGAGAPPADEAIHLYVRCARCSTIVHVRVDPRNELLLEFDDGGMPAGYRLVKEVMDARCFRLMRAELAYDRSRRERERSIAGGAFATREEYERQQGAATPRSGA